jgi:predicted ATPase with chaperone activity
MGTLVGSEVSPVKDAVKANLPGHRITVNLAPADILKVSSHHDLPIAAALMRALGARRAGRRN